MFWRTMALAWERLVSCDTVMSLVLALPGVWLEKMLSKVLQSASLGYRTHGDAQSQEAAPKRYITPAGHAGRHGV